ncbi:MAG: PriCT-2 domain-containing protein, partial [Polaromonas sp.]
MNHSPSLIRAALQFIPANLPRDEWVRVGMAIKSEFPDQTGLDLFTEWSETAEGYDAKAIRSTWQSFKAGGGVGIGTLLHLAKESGFTLPKADHAPAKPDPEAIARHERERAENKRLENARIEAAQDGAAINARNEWELASQTGESAYLTRKGIQAHGLRFAFDGCLLVPLRDAAGYLWNVKPLAATKPTNGGTVKLFVKSGRESG